MTEDNTRPVSVAELLARNGTIGSPPVSGHRRRKRRNAVSVAELTGEIPVVTDEDPEVEDLDTGSAEAVLVYAEETASTAAIAADEAPEYSDYQDYTPAYDETQYDEAQENQYDEAQETPYAEEQYAEGEYAESESGAGEVETGLAQPEYAQPEYAQPEYAQPEYAQPEYAETGYAEIAEQPAPEPIAVDRATEPRLEAARPPRSSIPLPRRQRGPERGHDPRPRRRASGAERMTYDPVVESVDLAELVAEQAPDAEELRSYLRSSSGTLFSGETVADDLARRGEVGDSDEYDDADHDDDGEPAPQRRGALSVLGTSIVAILQSLLAVVFGGGLFIAFDQLWRWNNIVALALSALVIAALMIGVHVVRKTEDFVSILIAALVGILVTFGPLALQST